MTLTQGRDRAIGVAVSAISPYDARLRKTRNAAVLQIGSLVVRNRVWLAPMAGISDWPFRRLAWQLGAGHVVAEMTAANPALWHSPRSLERRQAGAAGGLYAIQIAGSDPAEMADAARLAVDAGADLIDINMGCPAKKVCNRMAGSALLQDETLVVQILTSVVDAVDVPVTLKTRAGWSPDRRNAPRSPGSPRTPGLPRW